MRSVFFVIASAAMLLLATCDDAPTNATAGGQSSGSSQAAPPQAAQPQVAAPQAVTEEKKTVWPPAPKTAVAISSNLIQTNIMVVYDGSGSMGYAACGASGTRHESAVPSVKQFAVAVPSDASLGLFVFDDRGINVRVPLSVGNKAQFNDALDVVRIGSGTPLKTAMKNAYRALEKQAQSQLGYGRYIMLVVTDGEANRGEGPAGVVKYLLDNTPIEVHTVGLCFSGNHSLNQPGRTFYTDAQNPQQLVDGLKSALAEASEDDVKFD